MPKALSLLAVASLFLAVHSANAEEHMIVKKSNHDVKTTLDRVKAELKGKPIFVAARVDHAAAAKKVGLTLRPTEVLIFGNPKLGTQLMQQDQRIGVDLPLKVLAWEDAQGQTWIGYARPAEVAARYGIPESDVVRQIATTLEAITDKAAH